MHQAQFDCIEGLFLLTQEQQDEPFVIHLVGAEGVGRRHTLKKLAQKNNIRFMQLHFPTLANLAYHDYCAIIAQCKLEAMLEDAVVCFENVELTEAQLRNPQECDRFLRLIKFAVSPLGSFFIVGSNLLGDHRGATLIYSVVFSEPTLL